MDERPVTLILGTLRHMHCAYTKFNGVVHNRSLKLRLNYT